ncbi:MAG: nucleotidyltransferase family protein [Armatimonadota bacterium]
MTDSKNSKRLNELFDFDAIASFCHKNGIRKLSVFGSVAKGLARPDSDVDVLIEFDPDVKIGLFALTKLEMELSDVLGRKVDLVTIGGLKTMIRDSIVSEAEVLYAA